MQIARHRLLSKDDLQKKKYERHVYCPLKHKQLETWGLANQKPSLVVVPLHYTAGRVTKTSSGRPFNSYIT